MQKTILFGAGALMTALFFAAPVGALAQGAPAAQAPRAAETGDAMELLRAGQASIARGELREAWEVLGRAETRLLTRATPAPQGEQAAAGGAIGAIRSARQALNDRNADAARERTQQAISMVQSGNIVGANVPGGNLSGAGIPGPAQPLR